MPPSPPIIHVPLAAISLDTTTPGSGDLLPMFIDPVRQVFVTRPQDMAFLLTHRYKPIKMR
jgi:hypothetical protein